jgi:hypothetical protein
MPEPSWGEIALFYASLVLISVGSVALVLWLWPSP